MTALTLILAPEEVFDPIREVLQDWTTASAVEPLLWSHTPDASRTAIRLDASGATAIRIDELAATDRVDEVLIVDLSSASRSIEPALAFSESVERAFPTLRVIRVRAVFAGASEATPTNRVTIPGWFTVVLAPEDGQAPDRSGVVLRSLDEDPAAVAAVLCGVAGLWPGQNGFPLRDEPAPVNAYLRLARSYHRALDSREVESRLRSAVLEVRGRLPLPTNAGMPALPVEDTGLASLEMARAFWRRHGELLRGPRQSPPVVTSKRIGVGDALRLFFGFMSAAIRNAPRRWLTATLTRAKASTARALQNAIFGEGQSAFEVIVAGVTPEGTPATWLDQKEAAEKLAQVLDATNAGEYHTRIDPSQVWSDFAAAVLTLADAGERTQGLPAVRLNGRRGVIADPSQIVPGPGDRFRDAPPALVAAIGAAEVDAVDLLEAARLSMSLQKAEEEQATARLAAETRNALAGWGRRYSDVFAVRISGAIAGAFTATSDELAGILRRMRATSAPDGEGDRLERHQRRLARTLRIIALVFGLVLIGVVVLLIVAVLGPVAAALWAVGAVVAWMLVSFFTFVRGQATLFQILNERQQQTSQGAADEFNLREALRDLRRLGDLYAQLLLWSRVLGVVLARPFGTTTIIEDASPPLVGLPRSVQLGRLVPSDEDLARVAADIRRELFVDGWLGPVWEEALRGAAVLLGARGGELGGRPDTMYADTGTPDGLLAKWAVAFEISGVPRRTGDSVWTSALHALAQADHLSMITSLRSQVMVGADSQAASVDSFEDGVVTRAATESTPFRDSLLTPVALMQDRRRVMKESPSGGATGLGGSWTLVQWSDLMPEQELTLFREGQASDAETTADSTSEFRNHPRTSPHSGPFDGRSF